MTDFYVRQGDVLPPIQATLFHPSGAQLNLSGATVRFRMHTAGGALKVDADATIVNAAAGKVKYSWVAGDTDTADNYLGQWRITFPGGSVQTIPTRPDITIEVYPLQL